MKKKIAVFMFLIGTFFVGLPIDGFGAANAGTKTLEMNVAEPQIRVSIGQPRRRRSVRRYRNYGQYRRRQVGNRRYRLSRHYYWYGGRRHYRYVRIYY
ncbi:MAG: hypothetical protein ACRD6X_10155 [Pyrinomonadaceae bacterium]